MLKYEVVDYTIPYYGNKRCHPYGTLRVTDGVITKLVKFGYKMENGKQVHYITFNRKRYEYAMTGLYPISIKIKE